MKNNREIPISPLTQVSFSFGVVTSSLLLEDLRVLRDRFRNVGIRGLMMSHLNFFPRQACGLFVRQNRSDTISEIILRFLLLRQYWSSEIESLSS